MYRYKTRQYNTYRRVAQHKHCLRKMEHPILVISNMLNIIYIFKLLLYKTPVFNYKLNLLMINLWKFLPRAPTLYSVKGRVITSFLRNKNGLNFA